MTWNALPLREVCEVTMGQAPPGSSYNREGIGVPLLAGAGDFGQTTPEPDKYTNNPTRLARPGDLILCIRATIGEMNWADRVYCLGRGVAGLRPSPALSSTYLWHWMTTAKGQLARAARGSTFEQVNREAIEGLRVPLPPLPEQRRIAAILDKADELRRKRLEATHLMAEFVEAAFLEMIGDPNINRHGWELRKLSDVALVERGKFTPRPRNDPRYYGGSFPFIQTGDLRSSNGFLRVWKQTLNEEGAKVSKRFPRGTLAIAIAANIGDAAILDFDSFFPDSVVGIQPFAGAATPEFLEVALRFKKSMLRRHAPETAQKNINLQVLRPLTIPVPPQELQRSFSEVYRKSYAVLDRIGASGVALDRLFESLLHRAFRGEI